MFSSRLDYFRVTIKPEHEIPNIPDEKGRLPIDRCLSMLRNTLLLGDLIQKMSNKGACRNYEYRISYENISLKVPNAFKYPTEGICFELSSQGLDYFYEYLAGLGLDFRKWCGMLRALCFCGFQVNATRIDFAMDDITFNGDPTTISMKRVINAVEDGELCCKARVWSDQGEDFNRLFSYKQSYKRCKGEDLKGLTIQFGSRRSENICRFYDKFVEQKQKGNELPENCTAWTRCEFEYHDSNAMSVLNAFIDLDEKGFSEYMRGSALNFIRFVYRTNDNVSRCVVKRWWKAFLNGATKAIRFEQLKPARSAASKFSRWFKRSVLPSVFTFIDAFGIDGFISYLEEMTNDVLLDGRNILKEDLYNNLIDDKRYYEEWTGFKRFDYNSDLTPDQLRKNIEKQHFEYFQQYYKIVRLGDIPGKQEVISDVL